MKVAYCKISYWRNWQRTLERVREWLADSSADHVIVIADQTVHEKSIDEAEKLAISLNKTFRFRDEIGELKERRREGEKPAFHLVRAEFRENIPEFRNHYLEEARKLGVDWVAVSDSDEILCDAFRRDSKKIAEECEMRGVNVCEINCREQFEDCEWLDDADKLAASLIELRESWYYKQLFFKLRPGLRYVGSGGLRRVHETWNLREGWVVTRLPRDKYFYIHRKTPLEIWRNAARNMVIGGGGLDVGELNPFWKKLRELMQKYGFEDWTALEKAIIEHRIPEGMVKFFEECLDAPNTDWGRETRQLAKFFFWHNRECLNDEILEKIKNPPEPTDEQKVVDWVTKCYLQVLGRHPDPEGLEYWKRRIMTGQTPMHELPKYLMASEEYRRKMGEESVRLNVPIDVNIKLSEDVILQALSRSKLWFEKIKPRLDLAREIERFVSEKDKFYEEFYEMKNVGEISASSLLELLRKYLSEK